jgi:hypothetical protein
MSKGATVSKTEVPAYQEQAFKDLYAAGRQVAGMPFVPYTGPMVAGFSPDQCLVKPKHLAQSVNYKN